MAWAVYRLRPKKVLKMSRSNSAVCVPSHGCTKSRGYETPQDTVFAGEDCQTPAELNSAEAAVHNRGQTATLCARTATTIGALQHQELRPPSMQGRA